MRDIAAKIEVDIGTVSRALSGEPGVGRERTEQIRAFAQAAGYRPKPLRRKRSDAIGLVVRAADRKGPNPGYLERMVFMAEVGASNVGKHLHVHMLRSEGGDWPKFITENRVDGVLILGHGTQAFYDRLHHEPVPAVAINDTSDRTKLDCVMCDPTPGIQEAVRQLVTLGHRSIGLVITKRQFPTVNRRHTAYLAAMKEAGIAVDDRWLVEDVPEGLRGGQQAVRTYVSRGSVPSAILFNDDWIAMGGVYELARQGIRVPEHVSVVGYDNSIISEEMSPPLASIDNREEHLMLRALAMLQERMGGLSVPPREEIVPSHLVWRESCARANQD